MKKNILFITAVLSLFLAFSAFASETEIHRDGSSIEQAVLIKYSGSYQKSIGQEYTYIASQYGKEGVNYALQSQSLQSWGTRSYDVINIKLIPSGEEISVYFDITEVYGKF